MTRPAAVSRNGRSLAGRAFVWGLLAVSILLGSCATPRVGVQPAYRRRTVAEIGVLPFYSRSTFGLPRVQIDRLLTGAEQRAGRTLEGFGFEVVPTETMRDRLVAAEVWSELNSLLDRDLDQSFESTRDDARGLELLHRLHEAGHLDVRFLLIGEVVYHTATTCRTASRPSRFSIVAAPSGQAPELPAPCVVTHLQARLVDVERRRSVWFNRRLRESYPPSITRSAALKNIRATVDRLLGGRDGLGPLRKTAERSAERRSRPDDQQATLRSEVTSR